MDTMRRVVLNSLVFLLPLGAQVAVSRRDYAVRGRTFQQLWFSPTGTGNFKQLTRARRDHFQPLCSRDGKSIYFVSDRDAERSRNVPYQGWSEREVWSYDRATGTERMVSSTSGDEGVELNGVSADGALMIRMKGGLFKIGPNPWQIDNVDFAMLSPDGRQLAIVIPDFRDAEGQSHDQKLFITDSATGKTRIPFGQYEAAVWSPGGTRLAGIGGGDIAILDAKTGQELERVPFSPRESAPDVPVWSPDEKKLLVGTYGENGGSGDPQDDYFMLDLATKKWTRELAAQEVLWLPGGDSVLYMKPLDLLPLARGSRHSVWTTQLALYDLATHRDVPLTSGLVNNLAIGFCGK